jgi:hypothetical protein
MPAVVNSRGVNRRLFRTLRTRQGMFRSPGRGQIFGTVRPDSVGAAQKQTDLSPIGDSVKGAIEVPCALTPN